MRLGPDLDERPDPDAGGPRRPPADYLRARHPQDGRPRPVVPPRGAPPDRARGLHPGRSPGPRLRAWVPVPGPGTWVPAAPRPAVAALPPEATLAEGEEIVAGRHPVEEAFVAGRAALRLLVTPGRRDALERIVLHATTLRIPVIEIEGGSLTAVAGFDGHQGVALVVAARAPAAMADVLARAIERHEPALVLALDSLEDPQNVGTLLRSAEAAGVHGVVFPTRRQAPLSPAAIKSSAGATEHLLLAPVDDLPGTLADLHVRGLRIVGTDAEAALTYREADLRGPLVLVVGSEGRGLAPAVRRRCDMLVRIPMRGRIESLNAAVAGSVLVFEAAAQRGLPERHAAPGTRAVAEHEPPVPDASAAVPPEPAAVGSEAAAADAVADADDDGSERA
jgi:23S rRNA (guanosine2251-2'-O)-methyltransferase